MLKSNVYSRSSFFAPVLIIVVLMAIPLVVIAQTPVPSPTGESTTVPRTVESSTTSTPTPFAVFTETPAMSMDASPTLPAPAEGDAIEVGDTVEGTLTSEAPAIAYTFEGEADQTLNITLVASEFDSYLTVLDEDGTEIAFDDDSAGNLDSRISITLPADGTYTIIAQSYSYRNGSSVGVGTFTLTINEVQINRIEYTQEVEGELSRDELEVRYVFTGQTGDVIIAEHYADAYDSFLILEQGGVQLTSNDDGAGNLDSRIGPFILPTTGEYTLVVTSLSRQDVGTYTVTLDRVEVQSVALGDSVELEFNNRNDAYYLTFEAQIGDVLNISVESDVDTTLTLSDPSNYPLITDDNSGGGYNPEVLDFAINQFGTYTLVLRSVAGDAGSATVTISRSELPSLDEGSQTVTFSSSIFNRTLTYNAEAGQTYRITLDVVRGSVASPTIDITQNGTQLGYTSSNRVSRLSLDVDAPADGEIVLRLSEYSYTDIAIEVEIEEVGR